MDIIDIFYVYICIQALILATFIITSAFNECGLSWVNPLVIYKGMHVNWFGAILLAVIANVMSLPFALLYWLYKLCTVGRN